MSAFRFFTLVLGFLPFLTAAEAAIEKSEAYVMCRSQKTVRTIRVEIDKDKKECRTVYTKGGIDKEVGNAKNTNSCVGFMKNIRTNLEGASWNCREVPSAQITRAEDQ